MLLLSLQEEGKDLIKVKLFKSKTGLKEINKIGNNLVYKFWIK
jgi:hypothetical protein